MAMVSLPSDSARLRFQVLRRDCGLADDNAGNEIWTEYDTLKNKFAMEGDPIHWLACGTYVHILEHSLHADIIHLLKASKMNVPVFFFKLKRMLDIVGKTSKYKNHVAALEDEFNVAKVIFDKLDQLFADILEMSSNNENDLSPNINHSAPKIMRTSNRKPGSANSGSSSSNGSDSCSVSLPDIFHFIWVMFIWLKQHEQCGALKDDLLNCFHMLVCCFDCVITELFQHDKLNMFLRQSLMKDEALLRNVESGVGIISWLCTRHVAISDEAMLIQSKWLMPLLEAEIDAGRLRADVEEIDINGGASKRRILRNFLFPSTRFQHNLNYFSTSYAKSTNASNAFDERALLLSASSKSVVINGEMEPGWIAYNMHQRHEAIHTSGSLFPPDSYRTPPASPPLEHMISVTPSSRRASMFEKTPLTAKGQLPGRNANREKNEMSGTYTNVTSVLLRVRELVALLQNRTNRASPALLGILRQYDMLDVERELTERLRDFGGQFLSAYEVDNQPLHGSQRLGAVATTTTTTTSGSTVREPARTSVIKTFARRRLALTQILFWKLIEALVVHELQRGGGIAAAKAAATDTDNPQNRVDASKALQYLRQDQFARNLVALCLEVVLFCHQSNKKFPWTLNIFNISAFDFGLFTEFIIRAEPCLPRDVLRHLHRIEEQVYEELVWRDDSKLWPLIDKAVETTGRVPSFEDVAGRNQIDDGTGPFSPYRQARIQAIKRYMRKHSDSKLSAAAAARNLQWLASHRGGLGRGGGMAGRPPKRALEEAAMPSTTSGTAASNDAEKAANNKSLAFEFDSICSVPYDKFTIVNGSVMMMPEITTTTTTTNDVVIKTEASPVPPPLLLTSSNKAVDQLSPASSQNNNITALSLVLRKVYSIMAVRLRDLCDRLDIISADVRQYAQLWSALDLIFRSILPVLKNRHLDQLILCTIYVLGRLRLIQDKTFQDILTAYRAQPQASSVVYRQVYIGDQEFLNGDGTKTILEERADIINFYNAVFLKQIQPHVVALREQVAAMASPLPKIATRASSFSSKLGPNVYCSMMPSLSSNTSSMTDIVINNNSGFGTHGSVINYNPNSSNNMPSQGSTWSAGSGNHNNNGNSSRTRNNPLVQSPHRIVVHSGNRLHRGIGLKPEIRQLNRALDLASLSSSSTSASSSLTGGFSAAHSARSSKSTVTIPANNGLPRRLPIVLNNGAVSIGNSMPTHSNTSIVVVADASAVEHAPRTSSSSTLTTALSRFAAEATGASSSTARSLSQPMTSSSRNSSNKFNVVVDAAGRLTPGSMVHMTRRQQPSVIRNPNTTTIAELLGHNSSPMMDVSQPEAQPSPSVPQPAESQREVLSPSSALNNSPPSIASSSTNASVSSSSAQGGDEEEEEDDEMNGLAGEDDEAGADDETVTLANGKRLKGTLISAQTTKQFDSLPSSSYVTEIVVPQPAVDTMNSLQFEAADDLADPNANQHVKVKMVCSATTTKQFGNLTPQAVSPPQSAATSATSPKVAGEVAEPCISPPPNGDKQ